MDSKEQLEQTVRRCQNGDRDAFKAIFEQYHQRLKYYVRRLDGVNGNTDDMLQDIWITVFEKIQTLKEARLFPVWLYRIARNRVFKEFRQKDKFAALPQEDQIPVSDNGQLWFTEDDAARLHEALDKIDRHHREVLTLSFMEQLSCQSIADIIGCPEGTVRSRIFYAKQSLRREMERQDG